MSVLADPALETPAVHDRVLTRSLSETDPEVAAAIAGGPPRRRHPLYPDLAEAGR